MTLTYDNGQGLVFHRQIAVDDHYMFTIKDSVENKSGKPVTLAPYSRRDARRPAENPRITPSCTKASSASSASEVEELKYDKIEKEDGAAKTVSGRRRLARLHRQILGGDGDPRADRRIDGALFRAGRRRRKIYQRRLRRRRAADDRARRLGRDADAGSSPAPRKSRRSIAIRSIRESRSSTF